jgi:hypothetical protein
MFSEIGQKSEAEIGRATYGMLVTSRYLLERIKRWEDYRLLAIEGGKINLPNNPQLRKYFRTIGVRNNSPCAQVSLLYDIENDVIADAQIELIATDDRTLAERHIEKLITMIAFGKELVLFDQRYLSMKLIDLLMKKKIEFVMMTREKFDMGIDELGLGDHRVTLEKEGKGPVMVRVIKFRLPGGEIKTLISSLMDKKYSIMSFTELYSKRCSVEMCYNEIKKILEEQLAIENFSGVLVDSVIRLAFYTMAIVQNLKEKIMEF